jgi:hypothetical protein
MAAAWTCDKDEDLMQRAAVVMVREQHQREARETTDSAKLL